MNSTLLAQPLAQDQLSINDAVAADVSRLLRAHAGSFVSSRKEPSAYDDDECCEMDFLYLEQDEYEETLKYNKELKAAFKVENKAMLSSLQNFAESIKSYSSEKDIHERLSLALSSRVKDDFYSEKGKVVENVIDRINSEFSQKIRNLDKINRAYIFEDITKAEINILKKKILTNLILIPSELIKAEQKSLYRMKYSKDAPEYSEFELRKVFEKIKIYLDAQTDFSSSQDEFKRRFITSALKIDFIFDGSDELIQAFMKLSNVEFESSTVTDYLAREGHYRAINARFSYLKDTPKSCNVCSRLSYSSSEDELENSVNVLKKFGHKIFLRGDEATTKYFNKLEKKQSNAMTKAGVSYEKIKKSLASYSCECLLSGARKFMEEKIQFSSHAEMLDISIESNVFSNLRSNESAYSNLSSDPNMEKLRTLEALNISKILEGLIDFGYFIESPSPEQSEYILALVKGLTQAFKDCIELDENRLPISAHSTVAIEKAYNARHSNERKSSIYGKLATLHFRSESKARIDRMVKNNSDELARNGESLDNIVLSIAVGLVKL